MPLATGGGAACALLASGGLALKYSCSCRRHQDPYNFRYSGLNVSDCSKEIIIRQQKISADKP